MTEKAPDRKAAIAELTKSPHGRLDAYVPVGRTIAASDPDFFAHLIAWNHQKGEIRDAKIALPVLALAASATGLDVDEIYLENALAHLADLRPREFLRALEFGASLRKGPAAFVPKPKPAILASAAPMATTVRGKVRVAPRKAKPAAEPVSFTPLPVPSRVLRRLATRYLRDLEADRQQFERVAVQHRHTLHTLYARYHVERPEWVGSILFHGEKGKAKNFPEGVFGVIRRLRTMAADEASGMIAKFKIPFLVAKGALAVKKDDTSAGSALITSMSPAELINNTKALEGMGVKTNPVLRAAYETAIKKAATSKKKVSSSKAGRAADAMEDEVLASKLHALQEKQIDNQAGIEGDWIVFVDKSGSMEVSIKVGVEVAAFMSRTIKGKVHLVFFDSDPRYFDVTGMTLEQITSITRGIRAEGGTHMFKAMRYATDRKLQAEGIVFIGDGADHGGMSVANEYKRYCTAMGNEPTVFFYKLLGSEGQNADTFSRDMQNSDADMQIFDLRGHQIDYFALPNLVKTMRVGRYTLLDEINATPLRQLDEVLKRTTTLPVLVKELVTA